MLAVPSKLQKLFDNMYSLSVYKVMVTIWYNNEVAMFILDLNRYNQLFDKGVDIKDRVIGEYSYYTEVKSKGKKQEGNHYTLKDTGAFYNSFRVNVYNDGITISADDVKDDGTQLTKKFGIEILGLNNDSKEQLIEKITPLIIQETRRIIAK